MGPLVSDLRDVYFDVVRGKVAKYRHWNTPVYTKQPSGQQSEAASAAD
jgi:branched-chain amino acid aminotransferase